MLKLNMWSVHRLFEAKIGHPVFSATMARERFVFLRKVLRFDDPATRAVRYQTDRFAAFRNIFESWNSRCSQMLVPYDFLTIDECLYQCRNQLGFKTYNPNKPAKYGINIKCLNEVEFPYTHASEVYAGKPAEIEGAQHFIPTTQGVTVHLLEDVGWRRLQGCNLTTDNLYSSVQLAQLLLEHKMTFLGTMRMNRKGLTPEIKNLADREQLSTVVWHETEQGKLSLVSYAVQSKTKGKKNIILLSTIPNLSTVGQQGRIFPVKVIFFQDQHIVLLNKLVVF